MPKLKKLRKNSEDHLISMGIRNVGFERYEGTEVRIEGLKGEDFRWRVTMKNTGEVVKCSTLVECVELLKKTPSV
jgi:hypothetical protein